MHRDLHRALQINPRRPFQNPSQPKGHNKQALAALVYKEIHMALKTEQVARKF